MSLLFPDSSTIPGAPIYLTLPPGAASALDTTVSGPGYTGAIVGVETYIYVHTADASGGATVCAAADVDVTLVTSGGTVETGVVSAPEDGQVACLAVYTVPANETTALRVAIVYPQPSTLHPAPCTLHPEP